MKIKEIQSVLDEIAPIGFAEDFDNVGLLVGDENTEITGILVCHDALESVIDEAIMVQCNLVLCFHPILFSPIKKITGANYVEKAIIKAIKNDIAIYSIHTALDNHQNGVNKIFCNALGLINSKILIPKENFIQKLVTFVPKDNHLQVRNALFSAGAGKIGNYENCSFNSIGQGTYQGNENSNPVVGNKFEFCEDEEIELEVTFEKHLQSKILKALIANHKYEEVPYEIYSILNQHQNVGLGMIGELEKEISELEFLHFVKAKMECGIIKHTAFLNKKVSKVAVLGGSGAFAIKNAILSGADVFLTADLKYHDYYQAENQILLADIGHFESERFIKKYIVDFLKEKITTFAIIFSKENTNPVKYL
ncbi:MAG: Nif3-like dinuclear metal center hexameric protein [Flavobacterium sp.]|nr:Nif3-like dinuclear metal center hexameric protein [Flavobacterium sp.]